MKRKDCALFIWFVLIIRWVLCSGNSEQFQQERWANKKIISQYEVSSIDKSLCWKHNCEKYVKSNETYAASKVVIIGSYYLTHLSF